MIWKTTATYKEHHHRAIKTPGSDVGVDIRQHIRKLTTLSQMEAKDILRAFDEMLRVLKTGEDLKKFLYFLGNLDSIGICLLHNDKLIQQRAYQLLCKLKSWKFSKPAFDKMKPFLQCTLTRKEKSTGNVSSPVDLDDLEVGGTVS